MNDRYSDWDAAYVLGALDHHERLEYEEHLDGCARCAAAVAELGMMPGLLRLIPEDRASAYLEDVAPPAKVSTGSTSEKTGRPIRRAAAALVAAAVLAALVGVPMLVHRDGRAPAGRTVDLAAVAAPLRATVTLTPRAWGTEVVMTCDYTGDYGVRRPYALYVVDGTGHRQLVSRWSSGPGDTAHTSGATDLPISDIARVELGRAGGGVLLTSAVAG